MADTAVRNAPNVLVIVNAASSGPRRLTEYLTASDRSPGAPLRVTVVDGEQLIADPSVASLAGVFGVVLLGGGFMPDADERAPWLPAERRLARQAIDDGIPLLGICLGGQLLALVAGGEVTADSGEIERGCCGVDLLPAAGDDPLFSALTPGPLRMVQNHRDSVTGLPPGATLLARSRDCGIEAFRVGERAWGLQFHPEVDSAGLARWDEKSLIADGFDPAEVVARGKADAPVNAAQARTLFTAFADVVRRCAAGSSGTITGGTGS